MIPDAKLDFWIKTRKNVLLIGKKGVGKTTMAIKAMERNNIKYKYFSAPTLDPWVDFVGIPKESNKSKERVIEFIKPKWHNDEIECIILDEYSRASSKIRSACMELIQFSSINGEIFPNLKMVWAAINEADDEDYDVEKLDPAERDRFHVHYKVRYEPDRNYFNEKFGEDGAKCIMWWKDLANVVKNEISPRRLDYAMEYFIQGGELEDILPANSNIEKLIKMLSMRNMEDILNELRLKDIKEIKDWFSNQTNIDLSLTTIINNHKFLDEFLYYLPKEEIAKLISSDEKIKNKMIDRYEEDELATEILDEIVKNDANKELCKSLLGKISQKRLSKAPLIFGKKDSVKFNIFTDANITKFDEILKTPIRKPNSYYSSKQKIEDIRSICKYVPDNVDLIKSGLDRINIIALETQDVTFLNNQEWIALLNSYLLKKVDEFSIGSQMLIKKKFGCLFTKIVRMKLEGLILECGSKDAQVITMFKKQPSKDYNKYTEFMQQIWQEPNNYLYNKKDIERARTIYTAERAGLDVEFVRDNIIDDEYEPVF